MLDHKNIVKNIALLDLKAQFASIRDEVMAEVSRICDNQTFILGAPVAKLEEEIAAYSGAKFGIGCAPPFSFDPASCLVFEASF